MTISGVGPIVSLAFKATVDDPNRFKNSKAVAARLGLIPRVRSIPSSATRPVRRTVPCCLPLLLGRINPSSRVAGGRDRITPARASETTVSVSDRYPLPNEMDRKSV